MTPALDLTTLVLEKGAHADPADGMCVMEAVAYVANEPFSDHPRCASPLIASFLRTWNDDLGDEQRQILRPFVPRLIGTATTAADEERRAWLAADWLARECAPAFLRLAGLETNAAELEQLTELDSTASAEAAQPALSRARAAGAAARDAARDAAGAAAGDAARAAAGAAARAAARAALAPTIAALQISALGLLERMIAVGAEQAA